LCSNTAFGLFCCAVNPAEAKCFFNRVDIPESLAVNWLPSLYNNPTFFFTLMIFDKPLAELVAVFLPEENL